MHLTGLDGLPQQGVEDDHPVFLLVERTLEPPAVGEAGVLVHGLHGGFLVAAAHGFEDAVLRLVPLLQH